MMPLINGHATRQRRWRTTPALLMALAVPLAILATVALAGAALWADLDATGRAELAAAMTGARLSMLALLLVPALVALAWAAHRLQTRMDARAARLAQAVRVVAHANPAQGIARPGVAQLDAIAEAVAELAEQRRILLADMQSAVERAQARTEEEHNRLVALVDELEQSVLVCNREGRILLHNAAVRELLEPHGGDGAQAIGLGRSVFAVLDRDLVLHAVQAIEAPAARGERQRVHFVAVTRDGRTLRANVAPVFAGAGAMNGFVLLLTDVTASVESDMRSVALFQDLVEGTRTGIASIRAAIGSMIAQPETEPARRAQLAASVQSEAQRLVERLDRLGADVSARLRRRWPLEQMRGTDVLTLACRRIEQRAGLSARQDEADSGLWLHVDSFSLVQTISNLAGRLHDEFGVREVRLRLTPAGEHANLDLAWKGVPMSSETAFTWQNDAFTLGGEDSPISLSQVMERHGGEVWYQRDAPSQTNYFRLLVPLAPPGPMPRMRTRSPGGAPAARAMRPEFYDFDLFQSAPPFEALDSRRLVELSYTVFDTETTGLEPNAGDEIISIGAARIVNGRLLRSETFDVLVDPGRPISATSIAVHGITSDLLAGQPRIGEVLPRFWRFAQETVLVGHNVAFDMRFLELKEASIGLKFDQPVLDTLLLAAVVQPAERSQSLELLAARLGIPVIGRHTALGDALTTAEIFLALIPLLEAQGIHTLGQARVASEQSYYARLKY